MHTILNVTVFYDDGFTNSWSIAAKDGGQCDMPNQNDCDPATTHCFNAAAPTYYTCNCSFGYEPTSSNNLCKGKICFHLKCKQVQQIGSSMIFKPLIARLYN